MRDTPAVPNVRARVTASRSSTSWSSSSDSPVLRRTMPSGSTIKLRPSAAGAAAFNQTGELAKGLGEVAVVAVRQSDSGDPGDLEGDEFLSGGARLVRL